MSPALDARQRAMLMEMGVRVWTPPTPAAPQAAAPAHRADPGTAAPASARVHPAAPAEGAAHPAPPPSAGPAQVAAVAAPAAGREAPAAPSARAARGSAPASDLAGWTLQPPRLLYPDADPAQAPAALGSGWWIVNEAIGPSDPAAEAAERLLHAMLHALQLHRHPRVALCTLAPPGMPAVGTVAETAAELAGQVAAQVAAFTPAVVLVLGRGPTLAVLGRSEPLGTLRSQSLEVAGVPAVVSCDVRLLLRNAQLKAAAWADLCRARALAQRGGGAVP